MARYAMGRELSGVDMIAMFFGSLLMHGMFGPGGVAILVGIVTLCLRE